MKDSMIPAETIQKAIYLLRGQNIILDRDLAAMYGVPTKALKQAVKRNALRFPSDFMFVLSREEFATWRSQFVTSNDDRMGLRYAPMTFTEQGVAMLSSGLNSERAIQMNIAIMRTFTQMRRMILSHAEFARKPVKLEKKYDAQFRMVFNAIRRLMTPPDKPRKRRIGFEVRERKAAYHAQGKDSLRA